MPEIIFAPGVTTSPVSFFNIFNNIGTVPLTSFSPTQIVFSLGVNQPTFVLTGTGFTINGSGDLIGGTITGVEARNLGATVVTLTGLTLSAVAAQNAAFLDAAGIDDAALENMLLPLGWKYNGGANADVLLSTSTSADGVLLNFTGRDTFLLNGGNDRVWMGDGNDKGSGGLGRDTIEGGNGWDTLQGNSGNDSLLGGSGRDVLTGGTGNDTMNGGLQGDTFIFTVGDGVDKINGFDETMDRIDLPNAVGHAFVAVNANDTVLHYGPGADQVLLVGIDLTEAAAITFV